MNQKLRRKKKEKNMIFANSISAIRDHCPCLPIDGFIIGPGPPLSEFDS
jgi:hypothetical protein